jgi:ketosteroid isomerase-like protein
MRGAVDNAGNKKVVENHIRNFPKYTARALETGDPTVLAVDFTEDFFWVMPETVPRGGVHRGMPAVLEFLRQGMGLFEPGTMETEIVGMIGEGDYVAARINCRARSSTGKDYHNSYHVLFRVRDGKICELWDFQDTQHLVQACYE